jgi:hypothetical protein
MALSAPKHLRQKKSLNGVSTVDGQDHIADRRADAIRREPINKLSRQERERECGELGLQLIRRGMLADRYPAGRKTLHADNGSV